MAKDLSVKNMVVDLLENSNTTVIKIYSLLNDNKELYDQAKFQSFKKNLIRTIKSDTNKAIQLFPIIKYFESKRLTEEDLASDEILFTYPSGEKIAIASPIEVLDDVPEPDQYQKTIQWDLMSVDERESVLSKAVNNYYELIKRIPQIKKSILSWGRFVEETYDINLVEKEFFAENVPQEVFALHESDNLNALLPTELVQLDDPELEFIFYKNFVEKKLLSYQLWGIEREIIEDIEINKQDLNDRGPLIIMLDTSGSMRGITEIISKALALLVVDVLTEYGLNVVLCSFSTETKFLDLSEEDNKLKKAISFLNKSFYGGSDFGQSLYSVTSYLKDKKFKKCNIVYFSDFIFKNLDGKLKKMIDELKKYGHSIHSVKISKENYKNGIESFFTTNWSYVFNWKGVNDKNDEEELIKQLLDANIRTNFMVDEVETFGFLKQIKNHEFKIKEEPKEDKVIEASIPDELDVIYK